MNTTLTKETKKPCTECALLHPAIEADPCPSCRRAIRDGLRSGDMLNQSWFNKTEELIAIFGQRCTLGPVELRELELFRQSMNRTRTPYPIPGAAKTLTQTEWATISTEKLRQYRRHVSGRMARLIETLIASAER